MARTQVRPGDTLLFISDSLTVKEWMYGSDGITRTSPSLVTQINRDFAYPHLSRTVGTSGSRVVGSQVVSRTVPATDLHRQVTVVNSGVSGNAVEDVEAAVAARITNLSPADHTKLVVFQLGYVNNVDAVIAPWNPTTFTTLYTSIQTQLATWGATLRYVGTSSCFVGESYTASPPAMGPNVGSHDADLEAQSLIMASVLATFGKQFIDLRPSIVAWEIANNQLNESSGHALKPADGLHLSTEGARMISRLVYDQIDTIP